MTPGLRAKIGVVIGFLACAAATVSAQPRHAGGTVDGAVVDTALIPLGDATVSLLGSATRVTTNANGRFRIVDLAPGEYILRVQRIGYASMSAPIAVTAGDTLRSSFVLRRAVPELDTVVVAEKHWVSPIEREFDERRRLGWGQFMTQTEIEKLNFVDLSDVMRTFLAVGVGGDGPVNLRPPNCQYQTYLDGVPLEPRRVWNVLPRPGEVFGIEVYSGPSTMPVQFKTFGLQASNPTGRSGSFCGVILVWSKRGKS